MSHLSLQPDALPPTSIDALHLLSRNRDMLEHEFRTCISMINGFASILEEVVHPEEYAHARSIQHASNRLYRTLEHLLDFIHIESGDQPMAPTLLKIPRIARRTLENAERLNKNPDLEFVYQEQSANLWANIDLERFQHILMLLLENATHYATEGRIILTVQADEEHISIQVSDTGLGIEAEFLPHVFDPFTQQNRCEEGCGLGLALVKRLAETINGDLRVDSAVGEGTAFTLILPRVYRS